MCMPGEPSHDPRKRASGVRYAINKRGVCELGKRATRQATSTLPYPAEIEVGRVDQKE